MHAIKLCIVLHTLNMAIKINQLINNYYLSSAELLSNSSSEWKHISFPTYFLDISQMSPVNLAVVFTT